MSELKNNQGANGELVGESPEMTVETGLFASLNKIFAENPEVKKTFDSVMSILGIDATDDEVTEVECFEIDGINYIAAKKFETAENTYLYLVNENDVMDFIFQKVIVEDGEEYIVGLDSEKEFDLVQAYFQRDCFMQLKCKLDSDSDDKPDNH